MKHLTTLKKTAHDLNIYVVGTALCVKPHLLVWQRWLWFENFTLELYLVPIWC